MRPPSLRTGVALVVASLGLACAAPEPAPGTLQPHDAARIQVEVRALALEIADDLQRDGPEAWLGYFVQGPGFAMASDGQLVFPDWPTARDHVRELATRTAGMELTWTDPRVEPLTRDLALLRSAYVETITDRDGSVQAFGGFLTALAVREASGWRLLDLHWSSPAPTP